MINFIGGCISCDDRPEEYFIRTKYHRGFVWHFDTELELSKWEAEHELHPSYWSMRRHDAS